MVEDWLENRRENIVELDAIELNQCRVKAVDGASENIPEREVLARYMTLDLDLLIQKLNILQQGC